MNMFEFRERGTSGVDDSTEELAQRVIGAAIEVHRELGPGLPEVAYRRALARELGLRGTRCQQEVLAPIHYKGELVAEGKVDLLVEDVLVLELKVVESISDVHVAQTLSYLKTVKLQLGLAINFNVTQLRSGIKRVINTH